MQKQVLICLTLCIITSSLQAFEVDTCESFFGSAFLGILLSSSYVGKKIIEKIEQHFPISNQLPGDTYTDDWSAITNGQTPRYCAGASLFLAAYVSYFAIPLFVLAHSCNN